MILQKNGLVPSTNNFLKCLLAKLRQLRNIIVAYDFTNFIVN